ncbi:MAG TPA: DUF6351 family protein [Streptosporangiaceae bacterium]|nr:DUF6351 family protein [Streptosporangiaceae bacterium]
MRSRLTRARPLGWLAAIAAIGLVLAPTAAQAGGQGKGNGLALGQFALITVSNPRPELVSGGEVLARVEIRRHTNPADVRVTADGQDVTSSFHAQPDGSLLGLVTGLSVGRNRLVASVRGHFAAALDVIDHSINGPVFSGKQQLPFVCQTTSFGLAAATPPDCFAPTVVSYVYKDASGAFKPLADPATIPADAATAAVNGRTVPYIVRVETGVIDRAIYQTAALYDGQDPSPLRPDTSWNGKLIYTFGGGCNSGYHQGTSTGGVLNDQFLSLGYAVASSTLNVLDNNCSTIISAEAAMMVKEHFIDTYGPVRFTIGWGGSGGAIQQYEIADSYPGILDGIIPSISFPDPLTTAGPVTDCRLLDSFFAGPEGSAFTTAQKTAISGYNDYTTCVSWDNTFANRSTATGSCNPSIIPPAEQWSPANPTGIICNSDEQIVNQLGVDPVTGFPNSPLDNVGVQYGLAALDSGAITPDQFATLNASIGGMNFAGAEVPQRTEASAKALRAVYADDLINSAAQGLRTTPVIDQRLDLDFIGFGNDIHTTDWSFILRARLLAANGTDGNQVIIENQPTAAEIGAANTYELAEMDAWLTNIENDHSHHSAQRKVRDDKPADLTDGCFMSATNLVHQTLTDPGTGQCGTAYPVASNPRLVAGEPLTMPALKCSLKPLNFRDYPVTFTAAEQAELRQAFPAGVCDYKRPGVGVRRPIATWLSYGDNPDAVVGPFVLPPVPTG